MVVKKEFDTVKELVLYILENYPETRNSDNKLYLQCCKYLGAKTIDDLEKINLSIVTTHKIRQKIQNRDGLFRANKDVEEIRFERAREIKDYMVGWGGKLMRKRNLIVFLIAVVIFISSIGLMTAAQLNENTYEVTILNKEVKKTSDSYKYLIFTELENGEVRVFENTDSLLRWKFNSSDLYGELKEGGSFIINVYGFRIPLLSMYENIYEVEEVK